MKSITVIWSEIADPDKLTERVFCVNKRNEGLFEYRRGEYKQHLGTGQFRASTPREMMRKLRREYETQIVRMVRGSADGWN